MYEPLNMDDLVWIVETVVSNINPLDLLGVQSAFRSDRETARAEIRKALSNIMRDQDGVLSFKSRPNPNDLRTVADTLPKTH